MEFIEGNKLIEKEQDDKSKNCNHEIIVKVIDGENCRFCKHCGMIAHQDRNFNYACGFEWCRCMQ